jgi:hypothetical protein
MPVELGRLQRRAVDGVWHARVLLGEFLKALGRPPGPRAQRLSEIWNAPTVDMMMAALNDYGVVTSFYVLLSFVENASADCESDLTDDAALAYYECYFEAAMDAKLRAQALVGTGPPHVEPRATMAHHTIIIR